MASGAFSAGKIMPMGRRFTMILMSTLGIVGVALTLVLNFYVFNIGRLIYGFASGAQGAVVVRMINEYMPPNLRSTCIGIFATSQNLAALLAMFSAFILPDNTDKPALEANQTWRLILGFPGLIFAFCLAGFLFFFTNDSPRFYAQKGDR
mmetsp:Transcript_22212/g.26022  ORF Transcript_22212/g.26022 Transcript_22212/m.26022 type:complete len:150 (-) Transcript_22212:286-735(-)